jgi:hypothetical protein
MNAIRFLTTVAKSVHHKLFADANVLKQICESIILPNLRVSFAWCSRLSWPACVSLLFATNNYTVWRNPLRDLGAALASERNRPYPRQTVSPHPGSRAIKIILCGTSLPGNPGVGDLSPLQCACGPTHI